MIPGRLKSQLAYRAANLGRRGLRRKPPRLNFPDGLSRDYARYILSVIKAIEFDVFTDLIERLPEIAAQARMDGIRADDWIDDIDSIMAGIRVSAQGRLALVQQRAMDFGNNAANYNKGQFQAVAQRVLGVDLFTADRRLGTLVKAFASENAGLIQSIPEKMLSEVEGIVQRGLRGGIDTREITADIFGRFEVSESRAQLIARDQIAKINADITEMRQKELGIEEYEWMTSRDERVRPDHAALGKGMEKPVIHRRLYRQPWTGL